MLGELVVPAAALTALVGLFVAGQAYRGARRHGSATMRALAVGIVCLTAVPFVVAHVVAPLAGLTDAQALLGVVAAYVLGLGAIYQSLR